MEGRTRRRPVVEAGGHNHPVAGNFPVDMPAGAVGDSIRRRIGHWPLRNGVTFRIKLDARINLKGRYLEADSTALGGPCFGCSSRRWTWWRARERGSPRLRTQLERSPEAYNHHQTDQPRVRRSPAAARRRRPPPSSLAFSRFERPANAASRVQCPAGGTEIEPGSRTETETS